MMSTGSNMTPCSPTSKAIGAVTAATKKTYCSALYWATSRTAPMSMPLTRSALATPLTTKLRIKSRVKASLSKSQSTSRSTYQGSSITQNQQLSSAPSMSGTFLGRKNVLLRQAVKEANKWGQEKKPSSKPNKPGCSTRSLKEKRGEEATATIASRVTIRATSTDSVYLSINQCSCHFGNIICI